MLLEEEKEIYRRKITINVNKTIESILSILSMCAALIFEC